MTSELIVLPPITITIGGEKLEDVESVTVEPAHDDLLETPRHVNCRCTLVTVTDVPDVIDAEFTRVMDPKLLGHEE